MEEVKVQIGEIASDIMQNMFSREFEVCRKYFLFENKSTSPKRAGYYIGYLLVKEMARSYSLEKLIRLTDKEIVPQFLDILDNLGKKL